MPSVATSGSSYIFDLPMFTFQRTFQRIITLSHADLVLLIQLNTDLWVEHTSVLLFLSAHKMWPAKQPWFSIAWFINVVVWHREFYCRTFRILGFSFRIIYESDIITDITVKNTVTRPSFHSKLWPFSIIHQLTSKQSQLMYYWEWS